MAPGLERRRARAQQDTEARAAQVPANVLVVCLKGVPTSVHLDDASVRDAIAGKPRREVEVYRLPVSR